MAEEDAADEGISTVNINPTIVKDQRQKDYCDHERMIIAKDVMERRDITVLINRINDEYGGVTGMEPIDKSSMIFYCDKY